MAIFKKSYKDYDKENKGIWQKVKKPLLIALAIILFIIILSLSLTDALHIADNFYSIDFSQPQTLIHVNRNTHHLSDDSRNVNQIKAQKTVKAAGKAVGLAALFGGYGVLHVISGLVKPYMGQRK